MIKTEKGYYENELELLTGGSQEEIDNYSWNKNYLEVMKVVERLKKEYYFSEREIEEFIKGQLSR